VVRPLFRGVEEFQGDLSFGQSVGFRDIICLIKGDQCALGAQRAGEVVMGRSVEQLVNQQVLKWLQERRAESELGAPDSIPPSSAASSRVRSSQRPIITISREYGAYGGEMGRIVARNLHIDFHAQELVHQIAAHAQVRKQVVEALDERHQGNLRLWVDDLITLRKFQSTDYMEALSETISAIARHNRGVIVGRGGHLILDPKRTLRVRVYAPADSRAEYVSKREGMSLLEARTKVARVDDERTQFYLKNFSTDITDPLGFDLMINTASLSIEAGAQVIAETYRQRFG
jgi:cytidylate kinase